MATTRLGILGGGQLARMTAIASLPLGIEVRFLTPKATGSVAGVGEVVVGDWNDRDVLARFADGCNAITYENEWAPGELLESVYDGPVWPSPKVVQTIRHKGRQKAGLVEAGVPVPKYRLCRTLEEAREAVADLGLPVVAKRFEGSYDGYGNATVRSAHEIEEAWTKLAIEDGLLVEQWVPFSRELAMIVARSANGDAVTYPLVETEQKDHRCHAVLAPCPRASPEMILAAQEMALKAASAFGVTAGLMAVEMFELQDGSLLVNELAPRPHNTGHFTIEGCSTSQFENHARGVLGLPLGDTKLTARGVAMINLIGERASNEPVNDIAEALGHDVHVHLYGKQSVRPKRKMGHVTSLADSPQAARLTAEHAASLITL